MFDPLSSSVYFQFLNSIYYPYIKHGGNDVSPSYVVFVTKMPPISDAEM